jgi:L,D-transpeptidase catalytic domain
VGPRATERFLLPARSGRNWRRSVLRAVAIALCALAAASPGRAEAELPARFPAAGELLRAVTVREAPDPSAPVVRAMHRFRPDRQFQIVLALSARRGADGAWWYRLSLPGRPNGGRGWVRADAVEVRPVVNRIVVRLAERRIEVRRVRDGKLLLRAVVAVGAPGAESPLGRSFYVESVFVPTDPFYGTLALETSAFSRLTDWPDGGIVGIHGTNRPDLLGGAVSHGCIRVANAVARRLGRLAPLGTPIDVVR